MNECIYQMKSREMTVKKSVELKGGETIQRGSIVGIGWDEKTSKPHLTWGRFQRARITLNLYCKLFEVKMPSDRQLEKWTYDSVVKSVYGNRVEPDGFDSDGSPSWLLALGLI